jgi:hypothetical protein
MLTVFQNHLLPSGTNGTEVRFQCYIHTWDRIYKARKAVATIVLKEYEDKIGKKTMTERGKKKTRTGRKALLDKIARKLSPVILNAVKEHGLAVKIPDSWSEACPVLYSEVRGGDKGENLDCLIGLLLDMIVSTHQSASSLKFGTAWQSIERTAKPLDLDDSKLFAYNGEDMDLTKILRLLLQQVEFSSALNSILGARNTERQAAASTGKKKRALKKPNEVAKLPDSGSEEGHSSSGDEEDDSATLTELKQMQSKKADALKECVGNVTADAAGTDGGGHESECEATTKIWKDLERFLGEKQLTRALHKMKIPSDGEIDPNVYKVFEWYTTEIMQSSARKLLREKQVENGERELKERIRAMEEKQKESAKDQEAKILGLGLEKEKVNDKYDSLKARYQTLREKCRQTLQRKQISPSSSSSSSGTANKNNKKRTQSVLVDSTKNCQTKGSNKKAKSKRGYDSDDNEENTF